MGNVAEIIELVKALDDEGLKAYGHYLETVMKMTPEERKAFDDKIEKRLAELDAMEAQET